MKIGDTVVLTGVPENLQVGPPLESLALFQRCLGHKFVVSGLNEIGWAELIVESITGSIGETIWVEPEFLEVIPRHR